MLNGIPRYMSLHPSWSLHQDFSFIEDVSEESDPPTASPSWRSKYARASFHTLSLCHDQWFGPQKPFQIAAGTPFPNISPSLHTLPQTGGASRRGSPILCPNNKLPRTKRGPASTSLAHSRVVGKRCMVSMATKFIPCWAFWL